MKHLNALIATALRRTRLYTQKLWVRVVLMGLLAVVATGVSKLLELYVPRELGRSIDGAAADLLLQLIAAAMLSVTIFSITVMVSVYQSSSSQWTPRVSRLIMTDKTTQNTMAVFIGVYVYALIGIILRELDIYGDQSAFVLFWMTVIVLVVIVVSLIRWVLHLQGFGQLLDTTRQVERVTRQQLRERLESPCLGAHPLRGELPAGTRPLAAWERGFINQVHPELLNTAAQKHNVRLYTTRNIGEHTFLNGAIMQVALCGDEPDWDALRADIKVALVIGDIRNYEQDPQFGLIVMGEIGSKALSRAVNDAGTAIDVITRVGRVLSDYRDETADTPETLLSGLYVAPLDPAALLRDGFGAMSRDGAGTLEVQQWLQHTLRGLMGHPDKHMSAAVRDFATQGLARALEVLTFAPDRAALIASAAPEIWPK